MSTICTIVQISDVRSIVHFPFWGSICRFHPWSTKEAQNQKSCWTWSVTCTSAKGLSWKRVGVLGRLRRNVTIHAAFETHNSLILPIFYYCDVVWSSCNKADMESLESLQRRASKIIVKSKCGTTSTDYLKFQSLEDRRDTHFLGLVLSMQY